METVSLETLTVLDARDLDVCQQVFDSLCEKAGVSKDSEEASRIAAIVIDLYRQGVRDPDDLRTIVETARGLFDKMPLDLLGGQGLQPYGGAKVPS
jgi:hypothetical protein